MRRLRPYLLGVGLASLAAGLALPGQAKAWDLFRSESRDVRRGNSLLQSGQHAEALEAYETAASKLPKEGGVQLNRGLALMASDKLDAAREAFKLATQGSASKEVRAQSYYDLGLAFMQQAEAQAKGDKLDEAQGFLRESVDAFKSSLRNGPKNRDAAWNLELAQRRLVDVQKKQEEKKKQEDEKKKQEDEKKKQDDKENGADSPKQDGEQNKPGDQQKQDEQQNKQDEQQKKNGDKSDQAKQPQADKPDQPGQDDANPPSEGDKAEQQPEALPKPMQQALDALSHGEENLEKVRARMRAARQPQRVQKDW